MKEVRPRGGNIRILFAFDPTRTGVVLVADDRFGEHLEELKTQKGKPPS